MKPLARWTIGYCIDSGIDSLRLSIRRFKRIYPEFDRVICCNNLTSDQLARVKAIGDKVHIQSEDQSCVSLTPCDSEKGWKDSMPGWGWKLVPPRLRFDSHELWIDNDIIFNERIDSLDQWLNSNSTIISSAHRESYGSFKLPDQVPPVCAGFFGIPPFFNFEKQIISGCSHLNTLGHYDEQGLVSSIVIQFNDCIIVPMSELQIVKELMFPLPSALHFIGVNRTLEHKNWDLFKKWVIKC